MCSIGIGIPLCSGVAVPCDLRAIKISYEAIVVAYFKFQFIEFTESAGSYTEWYSDIAAGIYTRHFAFNII
ncbi:hypothetical protein ES703_83737 [subsurface metagenome]